jgi:hypothetical protein
VRKHYYFDRFEIAGNSFENLKAGPIISKKEDAPANFLAIDEVLKKSHGHLKFAITDEHMFKNQTGQNIIQDLISQFKGDRITIENALFHSVSL